MIVKVGISNLNFLEIIFYFVDINSNKMYYFYRQIINTNITKYLLFVMNALDLIILRIQFNSFS